MMLMMLRNIRYRTGVWQWLAVLLLAFLYVTPAQAGVEKFEVLAVGIDRSETRAEAYALDYARKRAVYLAVRKLGFSNASTIAATIPDKELATIIRGATVLQTKRVGDKTYAQVSVTIASDPLRKFLDVKDTVAQQATAGTKRTVMLLPAIMLPEKPVLWGKDNILRAPLSTEVLRQSHGSVILPGGDLQDLRLIDTENMMTVTMAEMKPMFERYGVDEVLIAIVTLGAEKTADASQVVLRRLSALNPKSEVFEVRPTGENDTREQRLAAVARSIAGVAAEIASSTAVSERAKLDSAKRINLELRYAIPKELATMQQAIRGTPGVLSLELSRMALNDASGTLYVEGDVTAIRAAISKQGVILRDIAGGWRASTR
jgi:hypothetical protein